MSSTGKPRTPARRRRRAAGADEAPLAIVGIGASAGGLEALTAFFAHALPDARLAYVVVQHLDPARQTTLAEILAGHTPLSVALAADGQRVRAGHVYVVPPDAVLGLQAGVLRVARPEERDGHRRGIDRFFTALAVDQGDGAVGVLLSGTGSDGAQGLHTIKDHGGVTVAQDPDQTRYDGMPRAAVATGRVDYVLPVEQIPALLADLAGRLAHLRDGVLSDEVGALIDEICRLLQRRVRHDFSRYKRRTILRRIDRRMAMLRIGALADYVELLRHDPDEAKHLFRELLINVTAFFRDPGAFDALRAVVRRLIGEPAERSRLRIWVPGCATGEEAYSIAMLVHEEMERAHRALEVQIFATDIDDEALDVAREGRYPDLIADHVGAERLQRYFTNQGDGWQVGKELRATCVFSRHDLVSDPPFSRMDVVSCRNLLIYLEPDLQKRVLRLFHYALRDGGHLLLGPAESIGGSRELFRVVDKKHRLFEARRVSARVGLPAAMGGAARGAASTERPRALGRDAGAQQVRRVLERVAVTAIVVDEHWHVVDMAGAPARYLEHRAGPIQSDVVVLARPELRLHLRTSLHRAKQSGQEVVVRDLTLRDDGEVRRVELMVLPSAPTADEPGELWTIVLRETEAPPAGVPADGATEVYRDRVVQQLEGELENTRRHLRSTIEELETSNEELKASNEELLSVNEELQSSNEELQTSREELQSVNEELETINAELRKNLDELDHAHADVRNLFEGTQIPTVFLDRHLRIKQFTPAATDVLRLIEADRERLLADIVPRVQGVDLLREAREVLRTLVPLEAPVRRDDGEGPRRTYLLRIQPYRTLTDAIDGVVLNFIDVTDLEQATERVRLRERQQAAVARLGLRALSVSDLDLLMLDAMVLVRQTLDLDACKVLELLPGGRELLLRAGIGWRDGLVGELRISAGRESQAGYTLRVGEPVITEDVRAEQRFRPSPLMVDHGIVSGITCALHGPEGPFGVLGAHAVTRRVFTDDDANFLVAVANVLANAITREHTLARLRESEARARRNAEELRTLYDTAGVGLAVLDRDLRFTNVNRALATLDGVPIEAHRGRRPDEILPALGDSLLAAARRALEEGAAILELEVAVSVRAADGARIWRCNLLPLADGQGRVEAVSVVVHDVTERRRAEADLRRQAGELQAIYETTPVGLAVVDRDLRFVKVNRTFAALTGAPAAHHAGRPVAELAGGFRDAFAVLVTQVLETGRPVLERETQDRAADGRPVHWLFSCAPIRDADGEARTVGCVVQDITDRKRYERALEDADRHKDEFLAMLGHELRNPLSAIRATADVLRLMNLGDPQLERMRAILDRQSSQMATLVDGLLDVSRIARGKVQIERKPLDLARLVRDSVEDRHSEIAAKGLMISVDLDPGPLWVSGDAVRLAQVLHNLLSNAIKFTDVPGRIEVRLRRDGDEAVLAVSDDGIGISAELMEHLFEPFRQARQSIDRAKGGLGLGLSLVKGLVTLHGGTVSARSEGEGRGTALTVRLPLVDRPPERVPVVMKGGPGRVLVIDDNADAAALLRDLLRLAGYAVEVAHDGREALDVVARFRPHAVVCDIGLPGALTGYDVAGALRSDESGRRLRLIALTGYGRDEDRDRSLRAGFDAHLTKPVDLAALRRALAGDPG